jgi:SOUL heme-binding protein
LFFFDVAIDSDWSRGMKSLCRTALALLLFVSLQSLITASARAGYESPGYRVISTEGAYEIRDYPALTLVSAPMPHRGQDGAFMKLFRFIDGRNDRSEKIAMTTPVLMTGTESGAMSFVVPKVVAERGVPSPSNPELTISTKPEGRFASYRYSGSAKPASTEAAAKKLLAWVSAKGLVAEGSPVFAYYDPPWTLWFMRRNEVLIRLKAEK